MSASAAASTTALGGRVAAAPPTVRGPRGVGSVPHTSSYVPPSSRVCEVHNEPGMMFSASSMTLVRRGDLEFGGFGPALVTTNRTWPGRRP